VFLILSSKIFALISLIMFEKKYHIIAANEGNSIALQLAGTSDVGNQTLCKNSGIGTATNPFYLLLIRTCASIQYL
jgi:hypothetical protein